MINNALVHEYFVERASAWEPRCDMVWVVGYRDVLRTMVQGLR
jgi:hypothetical protein